MFVLSSGKKSWLFVPLLFLFFLQVSNCLPLIELLPDEQPHPLSPAITDDKPFIKPNFINGFVSSLSMIIVSELGDKTFFIAAVMAMRHARVIVFAGAISALAIMTVLSAAFGYLTSWIPRIYTYYISTFLFGLFGFKMLYDGCIMTGEEGNEELDEVHHDIMQREENERSPLTGSGEKLPSSVKKILINLFSKVYLQVLMLTFLAEWGDRSQLATIVLAARENILGICIGGILGHCVCTGIAVLGGRMIAQRISVRTVTIAGGIVFLAFAVISLFMDPNN